MGLISKFVNTKINARNKRYYENLGYEIPKCDKHGMTITVDVNHIPKHSQTKVLCECDNCKKKYELNYSDYLRCNHDGKVYCKCCVHKVFHSGKNNNRWNPDLSDDDRKERRIFSEYTEFTRKVLQRDKYICQCCGVIGKKLEVHHIDGYNWEKEKRLDFSNVITLCEKCHNNFHDKYGRGNNTREQFESWFGKTVDYLNSYNGNLPPTKEIICLEDNKIFDSPKEAAQYANTIPSVIIKCCLRQESIKYGQCTKTVHGKHYIYLDDYNSMSDKEFEEYLKWSLSNKTYNNEENKHPSSKSVVCVNTKTVFKSGKYAGQVMKISNGGISECCRHKKNHCGLLKNGEKIIWMYLEEYKKLYDISDLIYYE